MKKRVRIAPAAPGDPFGEHVAAGFARRLQLLGGQFQFEADNRPLMDLVEVAYSGLQPHRLSRRSPRFQVRLRLTAGAGGVANEPPAMQMHGGAGLLCGTMDAANFVAVDPARRAGLVAISRQMLRFPYHVRYELLEFAVFTLAARAQGLVSLHAACVGLNGHALLLDGASGAGKSTVTLQCLLQGLDFLTEDATFVMPRTLRATGIANFLHLRADSLRFVDDAAVRSRIRDSPVIRRRSGVEKFEVDLRRTGWRLARTPPRLIGVVFISKEPAAGGALLRPLSAEKCLARFAASQAYAVGLPGWAQFARRLGGLRAFELRRGRHPAEAVDALRDLLQRRASGSA